MVRITDSERINACVQLLDKSFVVKINQVRMGRNESMEHAKAKQQVCAAIRESGYDIITEARFATGGRADILIPELFTIIEVLHSESLDKFRQKLVKYPRIRILAVQTTEVDVFIREKRWKN